MTRRLLLAIAAATLPLVLLELGLRGQRAWKSYRQSVAFRDLGSGDAPGPGDRAKLWQLLRATDNPDIVYELRPNLDTTFLKKKLTTNSRGFRRMSPSTEPDRPGGCTILGLGDSVMFGWGVGDDETYLSVLLRDLEARPPDVAWRVVNTAVPGYNLPIEVATLLEKGLGHRPDLVVLGWTGNDLDLPSFVRPRPSALTLQDSFVRRWLELRLAGDRRGVFDAPTIQAFRDLELPEVAAYLASLPPERRRLVGREAFESSMSALAGAASEHRFEVLVLHARGRLPRAVRQRARASGFGLLEIRETRLDARGGPAHLVLSRRDPHPSPLAHERIGEALAERLSTSGLAERACATTGG